MSQEARRHEPGSAAVIAALGRDWSPARGRSAAGQLVADGPRVMRGGLDGHGPPIAKFASFVRVLERARDLDFQFELASAAMAVYALPVAPMACGPCSFPLR